MDRLVKKELIEEAKNGCIESFTCIFECLRPALYAKALMFFGYGNEAKDVMQETFITAFSKIHQLKDNHKFNTWIHSILKNQCLQIKRDQKRLYSTDHLLLFKEKDSRTLLSTEDFLVKQNIKEYFLEVISSLEEKKRIVVLLRFYSDYNSYDEIAQILSIPVGTVRSRLSLAKKELHATLSRLKDGGHYSGLKTGFDEHDPGISEAWSKLYRGDRRGFLSHFDRDILIRFSSGKQEQGIKRWAQEWDVDLISGVRFKPNHVVQSGNLSIVEGPIINPPDKPRHCPPEAGFVFYHHSGSIYRTHLHYAPRK